MGVVTITELEREPLTLKVRVQDFRSKNTCSNLIGAPSRALGIGRARGRALFHLSLDHQHLGPSG